MPDYYVRHDAAGGGTGLLGWADAFNLPEFETFVEGPAAVGDRSFLRAGTYDFVGDGVSISSGVDGLPALPIWIIGVKAGTVNEPPLPGDWAFGNDRPYLDIDFRGFRLDDYWNICNLRATSIHATDGFRADVGSIIFNCKSQNSRGAGGFAFVIGGSGGQLIGCEAISDNGLAVDADDLAARILYSYIHDSINGVLIGSYSSMIGCIVNACSVYGLSLTDKFNTTILANTIYGCGTGILATTANRLAVMNNIIAGCTNGAVWGTEQLSNWFDHNNWWDNATDVTRVTKGANAKAIDPQFVNPAADDFRIGLELFTQGFGVPDGVATPSLPNPGAWQGRLPTVVPVGIDLSQDQLFLDNLESVTLNGILEENVYRLSMTTKEGDPSYAAYLQTDVIWQFIPDGVIEPEVGDPIIDDSGAGVEFRILEVRKPFMNNYWNCVSRKVGITEAVGLRDLITLWPVVVDPSEPYGSRIATHPAADPDFTDVPAKVQIRPVEIIVEAGKQQFRRQFDIYVDRDIDVSIGDLLKDQNLIQYDITSFQNRDRVDKLSHIVAEYTD